MGGPARYKIEQWRIARKCDRRIRTTTQCSRCCAMAQPLRLFNQHRQKRYYCIFDIIFHCW